MEGFAYTVFAFMIVLTLQSYDINYVCSACRPPISCASSQCVSWNGGPFSNNFQICVDDQTINLCGQSINFGCGSCSVGTCGYTINSITLGQSFSGCASNEDEYWPVLKQGLDLLYIMETGKLPLYDWCNSACWVSVGAIIGIIAGGLVFIILVVVGVTYYRKRKAARQEQSKSLIEQN